MTKYIYKDGERRVYRGIPIWWGKDYQFHWYIQVTKSIASGVSRTSTLHFETLREAKKEIDSYFDKD